MSLMKIKATGELYKIKWFDMKSIMPIKHTLLLQKTG